MIISYVKVIAFFANFVCVVLCRRGGRGDARVGLCQREHIQ